jgi:uncharacterized membrane protein
VDTNFYKGNKEKIKGLTILFIILVIGIALRISALDSRSFWFDEAIGILQAKNLMTLIMHNDNTPPFYFFILHYWLRWTDSEFGLRFLSVIFGALSIVMAFSLGKLLLSNRIGLISAFLLAISPFHIYYSQEARMYSLVTFLTLLSVYFLLKSLKDKTLCSWMGYVVFNLMNIYCHYMGLFIWLAQGIFFLTAHHKDLEKKTRKRWLVSNLSIFFFSIPWLVFTFYPTQEIMRTFSVRLNFFWPPPPSLESLFTTFKNFSIGYNASHIVSLFATAIFFFLFVKGIFKMRKQKNLILSLLCLFSPVLALFIVSQIKSVYIDRYLISSSLFYYFIVAGGLNFLSKRWFVLNVLIISLLSLFSLKNYYNNFLPPEEQRRVGIYKKKDHRAIAEYIGEKFQREDRVYHTCRNTIFPFIYYFDRLYSDIPLVKHSGVCLYFSEKGLLGVFEFDIYGRKIDKSHESLFGNSQRIWLILSSWDFDKNNIQEIGLEVVHWLDTHYRNISSKNFDGAIVYLYENSGG